MLEARAIGVIRGGAVLVRGISLTLEPGTLLGIVGPNGAGKSTLLRAMAGIEPLAAGTVALDGRRLEQWPRQALGRALAYLPQGGGAQWAMRVEQVAALGRLPHRGGADDPRSRAIIDGALEAMALGSLRRRPVTQLSGGERARVLIARALAVDAPYLLADEPTLALDPLHQLRLMAHLRGLARHGRGVAVVLHDLTLAARHCDRIAAIHQGTLAAFGAPAQILTEAALAPVYGVRMATGWIEGESFVLPWQVLAPDPDPQRPANTAS